MHDNRGSLFALILYANQPTITLSTSVVYDWKGPPREWNLPHKHSLPAECRKRGCCARRIADDGVTGRRATMELLNIGTISHSLSPTSRFPGALSGVLPCYTLINSAPEILTFNQVYFPSRAPRQPKMVIPHSQGQEYRDRDALLLGMVVTFVIFAFHAPKTAILDPCLKGGDGEDEVQWTVQIETITGLFPNPEKRFFYFWVFYAPKCKCEYLLHIDLNF